MTILPLHPSRLPEALALVKRVFDEFEAPDYVEEGIETFHRFIDLKDMTERVQGGAYRFWGAYDGEQLAGVVGLRLPAHISLLFVDKAFHRRGIARRLVQTAAESSPALTVNSSPCAVGFYRKCGFLPDSGEQTRDGIRFTPMTRRSTDS